MTIKKNLKKRIFLHFLFFFLLFFVCIFSPLITQGSIGGTLSFLFLRLPAALIFVILAFWGLLTSYLAQLSGIFLNFVTGPNFIDISYTNNEFVNLGLSITKSFVNLILVFILVYIALSIALRLKEYANQKTLIRLIFIALIVNFAPVFCGLIIDATNIINNYFLVGIQNGVSEILTSMNVKGLWTDLINSATGNLQEKMSLIMKGVTIILLNSGVIFAFLFFAAIYFFRYVALWVLIILSPLAFVSWILPATRKYWNQWWNQFIQWSIITIPLSFFLYLVMATVPVLNRIFKTSLTGVDVETQGILDMSLPYFSILGLLYFGFVIGLQSSAMGSAAIINYANKQFKKAPSLAKNTAIGTGRWTKTKIDATTQKIREKLAGGATGQAKWREEAEKLRAEASKKWFVPRYFMRGMAWLKGGGLTEKQEEKIAKEEESLKGKETSLDLLTAYNGSIRDTRKIAIIKKAIKTGKIGDLMNAEKYGEGALKEEEIERLLGRAKAWGVDSEIRKAFPHLAVNYITNEELNEAQRKNPKIDTKEKLIISKLSASDYRNISKEALKKSEIVDAILETAMGSHISNLIETYGREAAEIIENGIARQGNNEQERKEWLLKHNIRLFNFFQSQTGQALISIPEGPKPQQNPQVGAIVGGPPRPPRRPPGRLGITQQTTQTTPQPRGKKINPQSPTP